MMSSPCYGGGSAPQNCGGGTNYPYDYGSSSEKYEALILYVEHLAGRKLTQEETTIISALAGR